MSVGVEYVMTGARAGSWSDDLYGAALTTGRGRLFLRVTNGRLLRMDIDRWCARADACDLAVLRRCDGPVLDIGCGAGRLVEALSRRGQRVLGIDVCSAAVVSTLQRGGPARRVSVFDALPEEGMWGTALLLDGNIGIGGDPTALLGRTRQVVRPGGLLLVETADTDADARYRVRIDDGLGNRGALFPWAVVGRRALHGHAVARGWRVTECWTTSRGRHFSVLTAQT